MLLLLQPSMSFTESVKRDVFPVIGLTFSVLEVPLFIHRYFDENSIGQNL